MNDVFNTESGQLELFNFLEVAGTVKLEIKEHANNPNATFKYL